MNVIEETLKKLPMMKEKKEEDMTSSNSQTNHATHAACAISNASTRATCAPSSTNTLPTSAPSTSTPHTHIFTPHTSHTPTKHRKILSTLLAAVLCIFALAGLSACSSSSTTSNDVDSTKTVRIGIKGDFAGILDSVTPKIEALGYKVERVMFDDFVQPDNALVEGSIDINWLQHEPYMNAYNSSNNADLVMVSPKSIYNVFGFYSSKWSSIDEIPEGATICLCNDPSNKLRGLKLLESNGLIKLKDGVESPTQYDIEENPKNLQFIEAEISMVPQSINDCDGVAVAGLQMLNAGKDPSSYIFCSSDADNKEYAIGFVVAGKNKDAQWAKDIAKAVQCDELANFLAENKQGAQLPAWE